VQVHEPNGTPTTAHAGSANLMAPAGPGNDRAVTHGAYSAARRAPLEQHHRERLRRTYPIASDDLVNSAAKRAAMIDLFSAWIEDAGVVHAQRGLPTVSAPAIELRRLLNDHEAAMERLEESAATPAPGRLAQHLAANYGEQHVEGSARDSSSDAESA